MPSPPTSVPLPSADPALVVTLDQLAALRWQAGRAAAGRGAGPGAGPAPGRRLGQGLDQDDVRAYAEGDDARRIDWRSTARLGRTQVKLFREERERLVMVLVDLRPSMHFATRGALRSVRAAQAAALVAWHAAGDGGRLGGVVLTAEGAEWTPARRGAAGALSLIDALARLQPRGALDTGASVEPPLSPVLGALLRVLRPGAMVVVISAFDTPEALPTASLAALGAAADLRVIRVEDPAERSLPAGSFAWRSGPAAGTATLPEGADGSGALDALDRDLAATGAAVLRLQTCDDPVVAVCGWRALHGA